MTSRAAVRIVEFAATALPAGEIRRRYENEFVSELYGLSRTRQIRHALAILCTAIPLRHALGNTQLITVEARMVPARPRRPIPCRLNLHHQWRINNTEDGGRYFRCRRCGKDRPDSRSGPGDWMASAGM
jgi:hypothetical protein